ncbi:hypothetical protein BGZ95_010478, partial [Linnemannia exigua]
MNQGMVHGEVIARKQSRARPSLSLLKYPRSWQLPVALRIPALPSEKWTPGWMGSYGESNIL